MRRTRASAAIAATLAAVAVAPAWRSGGGTLSAAPPAQFRVWGSAGPDLPAPPAGRHEAAPEAYAMTWAPTGEDRRRGFILFARDPLVPVSPRVSVTPPGGRARPLLFLARSVLRPCEVVFGPAALAPGAYDAKVELLDAQGKAVASQTQRFRRVE